VFRGVVSKNFRVFVEYYAITPGIITNDRVMIAPQCAPIVFLLLLRMYLYLSLRLHGHCVIRHSMGGHINIYHAEDAYCSAY